MSRVSAFALSALAAALLPSSALAATTLLKLGQLDTEISPASAGAAEFLATGHTDAFVYEAGTLPHIDTSPAMPGYLAIDSAQCGGRGCARVLSVRFDLPAPLANQPLNLLYSRYGSELDTVRIDGVAVAHLSGDESSNNLAAVGLSGLSAGTHTLTIQYNDSANASGHWIDFVRIVAP